MFNFLKRWFTNPSHRYWTAYRFHGGGIITSSRAMTEDEAVQWVSTVVKGEVAYIDRDYGFIFYRPKD